MEFDFSSRSLIEDNGTISETDFTKPFCLEQRKDFGAQESVVSLDVSCKNYVAMLTRKPTLSFVMNIFELEPGHRQNDHLNRVNTGYTTKGMEVR